MRQNRFKSLSAIMVAALTIALMVPVGVTAQPGRMESDVKAPPSGGDGVSALYDWVYADMYEPNDIEESATPLPGDHIWATLHHEDDRDYYKFSVTETGTPYVFETQYTGLIQAYDTGLELWDDDDNELANDDDHDYFDTYSSMIEYEFDEVGTYYIVVYSVSEGAMDYQLWVTEGAARRLAGEDRYKTNVAVTNLTLDTAHSPYDFPHVDTVYVASGVDVPDALAASSLLYLEERDDPDPCRPLLITNPMYLNTTTAMELERLAYCGQLNGVDIDVVILGGTSAVSAAVEASIKDIVPDSDNVFRIAGANRYETAALIAEYLDDVLDVEGDDLFIVNGTRWADALSAGPVAAYDGYPILLTRTDALPQVTIDAIDAFGPSEVYIVGGEAVVSAAVETALGTMGSVGGVTRIDGANRYETSYEVADYFYNEDGQAMLVCGEGDKFADALSAVQLANYAECPLLLTPTASLSPWVEQFFDDSSGFDSYYNFAVGGQASISDAAFDDYQDLWMDYLP